MNTYIKNIRLTIFYALAASLFISSCFLETMAADNPTGALLTVHGTLRKIQCSFGDKPISVEFGEVYIGQINGDNYNKPIDYTLNCPADVKGVTLHMKISGAASNFDSQLLKTDVPGLAIKLLNNSQQIKPDEDFIISEDAPPKLNAVLVRDSAQKLPDGKEFNGTATLTTEWQ